jgi:hypothetical protein
VATGMPEDTIKGTFYIFTLNAHGYTTHNVLKKYWTIHTKIKTV